MSKKTYHPPQFVVSELTHKVYMLRGCIKEDVDKPFREFIKPLVVEWQTRVSELEARIKELEDGAE